MTTMMKPRATKKVQRYIPMKHKPAAANIDVVLAHDTPVSSTIALMDISTRHDI